MWMERRQDAKTLEKQEAYESTPYFWRLRAPAEKSDLEERRGGACEGNGTAVLDLIAILIHSRLYISDSFRCYNRNRGEVLSHRH